MKKALTVIFAFILVVVISVTGTMAYLTSTDVAKNTFTVGDVKITLDEAEVGEDGQAITPENRVAKNKYHILPGQSYDKDPQVHVDAKSEDCYVRVFVDVSKLAELKAIYPKADYADYYYGDMFKVEKLISGWDKTVWPCVGCEGTVYEFRYNGIATAGQDLDKLFTKVVVPGDITNTQLATLEGLEINVTAQAIQAAGFSTAALAWAEFPTT